MGEHTIIAGPSAVHNCCEVVEQSGRWDKVGLFLSSLCAIHCLLTPLLVLALPVLGEIFEAEWAHIVMALFVVPVGLFAFWSGFKHHRDKGIFALGVAGLFLIAGASVAPHEWVEIYEYDVVTILGSFLLIAAHLKNRRACLYHKHAA